MLVRPAHLRVLWIFCPSLSSAQDGVFDLGNKLELFVDSQRIERLEGVKLTLHSPREAETAIKFDEAWEGVGSAYVTVLKDGDKFRMYYRGATLNKPEVTCLAESPDGITWTKPKLGLFEWEGSKENNIVWMGSGTHNFTPFLDTLPGVPAYQRYKAIAGNGKGQAKGKDSYISADGVQWRLLSDKPGITNGAFDSQNLAYWDSNRQKYVCYFRVFTDRIRDIAVSTSDDFLTWSDTKLIEMPRPHEHFYTNATVNYFRAPHYYLAFPKRFIPNRKSLPDHTVTGISDAVLLTSRDGLHFDRQFKSALIRPGLDIDNWGDRSQMPAWGLHQTSPTEMSLYYSRHYRVSTAHMVRGVFRLDGIASAQADYEGGEVLTKPLKFTGKQLVLNFSTSAAGSVRVEVQDLEGRPLPGYSLDESPELYGDSISQPYTWSKNLTAAPLAGKPVRLRFVLKDADLYSYRFADE